MYDVTSEESFSNLSMWLHEVEQHSLEAGRGVVKLLVGNKVDQARVVGREAAQQWARDKGMMFLEASAKTKQGVTQVFQELILKVIV